MRFLKPPASVRLPLPRDTCTDGIINGSKWSMPSSGIPLANFGNIPSNIRRKQSSLSGFSLLHANTQSAVVVVFWKLENETRKQEYKKWERASLRSELANRNQNSTFAGEKYWKRKAAECAQVDNTDAINFKIFDIAEPVGSVRSLSVTIESIAPGARREKKKLEILPLNETNRKTKWKTAMWYERTGQIHHEWMKWCGNECDEAINWHAKHFQVKSFHISLQTQEIFYFFFYFGGDRRRWNRLATLQFGLFHVFHEIKRDMQNNDHNMADCSTLKWKRKWQMKIASSYLIILSLFVVVVCSSISFALRSLRRVAISAKSIYIICGACVDYKIICFWS